MKNRRIAASLCIVLLPGCLDAQQPARCTAVGGQVLLPGVREASGAALGRRASGIVWTHDDSGEPAITALDTTGQVKGRLWVAGAQMVDWEDISIGPCPTGSCLYVADIGDNNARRRDVIVYRFTEPSPQDRSTRDAEAFRAIYPDGAHDAEAAFVTADGRVYIVSKGETGAVALYRYPTPLRIGLAEHLEKVVTLSSKRVARSRWITGASASPDGKWVVLRSPQSLSFYRTERLTQGNAARPIVFDIRAAGETQGEGIALANNGTVYLLGEGGGKNKPGTFAKLSCKLP